MTEDMLDLLAMILVLAIVVAIGFGLILPLISEDLMSYTEDISDKSIIDAYEGLYEAPQRKPITAEEVVLMTQVQDSGMPLPRAFSVGSNIIEVESTYKLVVRQKGVEVWNALPSKSALYTVGYDFGGKTGTWVETFRIEKE